MNKKKYKYFLISYLFLIHSQLFAIQVSPYEERDYFPLVSDRVAALLVEEEVEASVLNSVRNFQKDVKAVTGKVPVIVQGETFKVNSPVVLVGTLGKSPTIEKLIKSGKLNVDGIDGKWEVFQKQVVKKPFAGVDEALVIVGSDPRGTIFGVYDLSEKIGVAPWYWWADVPVKHHDELYVDNQLFTSAEPSVKFRGIFLNDEDWGLQPWAAKTFEPQTGDIGPKTYAMIFELLLRLKANFIWPAMHPSTKAFFSYPGNAQMARDYGIVIGTSHAEPMLRNNVDEWNHDEHGDFNYFTNRNTVYNYWDERVKESKGLEAIYTVGMRGVHDSGMEGAKSTEEAVKNLGKVIADQRKMLSNHIAKDVVKVPQAFTAYKEVLGIYDAGLDLPEDITLVWPDDNYGYIRRLSDFEERKREGGAGVYYHASYWGRPHDYLWLSSTHPALIREEMMKAYELNARDIWVMNVGDIKPLEYNIQLFLDMAYNVTPFQTASYAMGHMEQWYANIFEEQGTVIGGMMKDYYQLSFERRPEFMGWSQTEPTTSVREIDYSPFQGGDEIDLRLKSFQALEDKLVSLKEEIDEVYFPAFYQLVYYPVKGASLINKKFLFRQKAIKYHEEGRLSAVTYKEKSHLAYRAIKQETEFYNNQLLAGKWKYMMDDAPRRLPVYQDTEISFESQPSSNSPVGISIEQTTGLTDTLPVFNSMTKRKHFFDVFLKAEEVVSWAVVSKPDYIILDHSSGTLSPGQIKEERVWVSVNWEKFPNTTLKQQGEIVVQAKEQTFSIPVVIDEPKLPNGVRFVADNGQVVIYAENYDHQFSNNKQKWQTVEGLGHSGAVMASMDLKQSSVTDKIEAQSSMTYAFYVAEDFDNAYVTFQALPTHPVTSENGLRLGYSVNGETAKTVDFETQGRSEEWKQNVLRNKAIKTVGGISLHKGVNTLTIYWVDPGVLLDVLMVDLIEPTTPYLLPRETKKAE
ncbi:glycosyl hydrolase 115 family protein [Echinicola sp. 20G]|uniref:glycosyl hydrolase 115 family protein n=1 Tax=Echinicola sp. 20G TaxID=2781961 RepID=UPI0019110002|nr:glycosyl hydrolase 115 family protein [Echinicola sp. 20G]